MNPNCSKAQIIATIGPASSTYEILSQLLKEQLDIIRFNFSWANFDERVRQIEIIRTLEKEIGRRIPLIQDLPGPRIQYEAGHSYDDSSVSCITPYDKECIEFGVHRGLDYIALSFVGRAEDVEECRSIVQSFGGTQKIIAKIERQKAVDNYDAILASADAIMVARGDLGNEVPIEKIPFVQAELITKANQAMKPVIVATQMLTSMVSSRIPTRAEVTDVANAILQGADAVMLSEESSIGKYPVEAVAIMERIILEAEKHLPADVCKNALLPLTP